jgi:hypothetical protein
MYDGGECGDKNANESMVVPVMGNGSIFFGGSLDLGGRFCVDAFAGICL